MASAYLSRTPSSAGNRKTWTWSGWVKLFKGNSQLILFSEQTNSYPTGGLYINGQQEIRLYFGTASNSFQCAVDTDAKYRDVSGWYHIVCAVDTTQVTDSDRVKFYVNGVLQTELNGLTSSGAGSSDPLYPSQNYDCLINTANVHYIGGDNNYSADCSMTHVHFIDGTQYQASNFGETDSTTGIWKPKTAPSVTYGTNGFFLKFENSGAFGTDSSGNSNNFTVNGTMTQTIDTPSNVFATWNPLVGSNAGGATVYYPNLENGNTKATPGNTAQNAIAASTLGASSGKWYAEFVLVSETDSGAASFIGVTDDLSAFQTENIQTSSQVLYGDNGTVYSRNSSTPDTGTSFSTGDVVGVALDLDNNYIYFSVNGTFVSSGDPTSGSSGTGGYTLGSGTNEYFFMVGDSRDGNTSVFTANFGNGYFGTTAVSSAGTNASGIGIFEYDVPTGYTALSTKGLNL